MATTKTAPLSNNTHKILKTIQKTLNDKYGINMKIQDIIAYLMPDTDIGVRKIIEKINEIENIENDLKLKP